MDIKYLPMMPHDPQKRYLLVAIDRATRWVYLEVVNDLHTQSSKESAGEASRWVYFEVVNDKTAATLPISSNK